MPMITMMRIGVGSLLIGFGVAMFLSCATAPPKDRCSFSQRWEPAMLMPPAIDLDDEWRNVLPLPPQEQEHIERATPWNQRGYA